MRSLSYLLEQGDEKDSRKRLRFFRSLVPNAAVLAASDGFVCGLCGTSYAQCRAADECLARCVKARQNDGVVTAVCGGESYTCPTCNRQFARREDALDCHGRQRRLSKIFLSRVPKRGVRNWDDSQFVGLKESETPGAGRLFGAPLRLEAMVPLEPQGHRDFSRAGTRAVVLVAAAAPSSPAPRQPGQTLPPPTRGPVAAPPPASPASPAPRASAPAAAAPAAPARPAAAKAETAEVLDVTQPSGTAADAGEGPFRTPGMKPFTRQDARYKCSVCSQMYFTRSEVENCFNAHPERAA